MQNFAKTICVATCHMNEILLQEEIANMEGTFSWMDSPRSVINPLHGPASVLLRLSTAHVNMAI